VRRTFCQPAREEALRAALAQRDSPEARRQFEVVVESPGSPVRHWRATAARPALPWVHAVPLPVKFDPQHQARRGRAPPHTRLARKRSRWPSVPITWAADTPQGRRVRRDEGLRRLEADRATVPLAVLHASGTGVPEHGAGASKTSIPLLLLPNLMPAGSPGACSPSLARRFRPPGPSTHSPSSLRSSIPAPARLP